MARPEPHPTAARLAGLTLVVGPMAAGKTTEGLRLAARQARALGAPPLVVRHRLDVDVARFGGALTRDGAGVPAGSLVAVVGALAEVDPAARAGRPVLVDEGQFFGDLALADGWAAAGPVVVCALSGDFRREPFAAVAALAARADVVVALTAVCGCGADAPYSMRTAGGTATIEAGDGAYSPACRACWRLWVG